MVPESATTKRFWPAVPRPHTRLAAVAGAIAAATAVWLIARYGAGLQLLGHARPCPGPAPVEPAGLLRCGRQRGGVSGRRAGPPS